MQARRLLLPRARDESGARRVAFRSDETPCSRKAAVGQRMPPTTVDCRSVGAEARRPSRRSACPLEVTAIHDFHSAEQARVFAASPELKAVMEKSGVKGAPQIWYTTKSSR